MTYSIVARCARTGQLGVGVQSHFFGVGAVVPWVEAGLGAVATQAVVEVAHGPDGLSRMRAGDDAPTALTTILGTDRSDPLRQVGIVDARGRAAAYTGDRCIVEAGHVVGDGYATQANMMLSTGVPEAMAEAFERDPSAPLWERIADALDGAESLGGDIRGRQSAAIVVCTGEPSGRPEQDKVVDVRVDDHVEPLVEVRRLAALAVAYGRLEEAEGLLVDGDAERALPIYDGVLAAHPGNHEFAFWTAVALAGAGHDDRARDLIAPVFAAPDGDRWRELLRRLPPVGLVPASVADTLLR